MPDLPIALLDICLLLITSFIGSVLTAAVGVGGGSLMLVVMASLLPLPALIPVHGCVQLGSNALRFSLTRQHVQKQKVLPFIVGASLATLAGVLVVSQFEFKWLPLIVGLFILWMCWGNMPQLNLGQSMPGMFAGGAITTYASLFVGASGPLVAAWLGARSAERWQYTANFSACMTVQHALKMVVFGIVGFVFTEWLVFIAGMILFGFAGTKAGLRMLNKVSQSKFQIVFKLLLTLLALRLLWTQYGDVLI